MIRSTIVHAVCLLAVAATSAFGQGRGVQDRMMFLDYGDRFHAEAVAIPTERGDSARIIVMFRLANDFLTFVRNDDRFDIGGNFKAEMSVSIEVRDSLGVIRQRVPWKDTAYTNTFEETNSKTDFHYGWSSVGVGPGTYVVSVELLAKKESQQRKLKLPALSFNPLSTNSQITQPIFGLPLAKSGGTTVQPFIFGGNVSFGAIDAVALLLVSDSTERSYDYIIRQLPYDARDIRWWAVSEIQGRLKSRPKQAIELSPSSTNDTPLLEIDERSGTGSVAIIEVPIPVTGLVPGRYEMVLVRVGGSDTMKIAFQILWETMPLSLRTINYGVDILRYVATADVHDAIDGGSDAERREKLMAYWRQQDPTPNTTYNERMAEYYRRVDQAFFIYSTLAEPDGAHADRGKIYIFYGPPSNVAKKLAPNNKPVEVWTYSNSVNKTFSFEVDDKGQYKLKRMNVLK